MTVSEGYFRPFRENTIGWGHSFRTAYGEVPLVYADWTASGRLYGPIEELIARSYGPFVGNTHSAGSETGEVTTKVYDLARATIKRHLNAGPADALITYGAGTTAVVNKLQRLIGLRVPAQMRPVCDAGPADRPVVFVTHMEHHSNEISWRETLADVVALPPGADGRVDPDRLADALREHRDRRFKIGAFTACSNVTGIETPYHELARLMHLAGGYCFVDFAAAAAYAPIDMHPADDPLAAIDAAYFSPHKFLGGPGGAGVVVFRRDLCRSRVPDNPGGGTVAWTSPWGHRYLGELEVREDGGTPGFLQALRAALAIKLKEAMGTGPMLARERQLLGRLLRGLASVGGLHVLAGEVTERLGIVSFCVEGLHYNLLVKLLNDRFGVQVRGGCSCAGSYGHYLLGVGRERSRLITDLIDAGDLSDKPGWVRVSLHPIMTDGEIDYIVEAIRECVRHGTAWGAEYDYDPTTNEFSCRSRSRRHESGREVSRWFELDP